jgi:hypothetical protein
MMGFPFTTPGDASTKQRVADMTSNTVARSLAASYGLDIQRVSWEDTARFKGSSWGPNISDMTLCCGGRNMPVIRRPNLADLTCDVAASHFSVLVGNEAGAPLTKVSLEEYVRNIQRYTGNSAIRNLWRERDATLLLSSQACVLPARTGKVNFNVKLYNYQSSTRQPAVLVVMASHQGTSCQVLTGNDDLYLNLNGHAHDFAATRLKEDRAARGVATEGAMTEEEKMRNVIFIYQIPLKVRHLERERAPMCFSNCDSYSYSSVLTTGQTRFVEDCRGMDHAMLSQGDDKGAYPGTRGLALERDPDYPIRLTLQYYYVTDTADIGEPQMRSIAEQLERSYTFGTGKGSLVFNTTQRATEPTHLPPVDACLSTCV